MTQDETLIYLVGIIDGEGYIGIKKDKLKGRGLNPAYYERLSVAGIHKPMIDLIFNFFKCGNIQFHKPSKISKRGYWSWEVTNHKASLVIQQIYPYMMVKKAEATLILELTKSKNIRYRTVPKEVIEDRERLYQAVKALHTFIPL